MSLSREWLYVLAAVFLSSVFFWTNDAKMAAHLGWLSLGSGVLFLGYVVSTGIRAKRLRRGEAGEPDAADVHRIHVAILTGFILIGVVGMEIAVRKVGGLWGNEALLAFHLVLVGFATVAFILARFRITGLRDRGRHKYAAYTFIVFFVAAFATGTILLFEQFPPA
ncbi:MAG: hypothetical protein AAB819_00560 [Patescibacteria group bacterium]